MLNLTLEATFFPPKLKKKNLPDFCGSFFFFVVVVFCFKSYNKVIKSATQK